MGAQLQVTGYSDEQFEIANNKFVNDGYEFVCWNTKADGTGTDIQPNELKYFQVDTTLYAKWKFLFKYMQLVKIGNVEVNSNIAEKYNVGSGLRTPDYFDWNLKNSFTLVLKLTTGSDVKSKQIIWRMSDYSNKCNLCLYDSKLLVEANSAASSTTFAANTTYYLKIEKNGTSLVVYRSTDGVNFTSVLSTTLSLVLSNQYFVFGYNYSYTATRTVSYQKAIPHHDPIYKTEDHWYTKNGCAYADKNGRSYSYETKLKHATNKAKKSSNGCGYWGTI